LSKDYNKDSAKFGSIIRISISDNSKMGKWMVMDYIGFKY